MVPPCVGPARLAVVAPLRRPARVAPGEDLVDLPAVDHHHDRREQRRDGKLGEEAREQARRPAAAAAQLGAGKRTREAHQLGQEQHEHGQHEEPDHALRIEVRPGREELEACRRNIPGRMKRACRLSAKPKPSRSSQMRRGAVAHDADAPGARGSARRGRARQAPWRAAGCPAPSGGRAPRCRSARAGSPPRSPPSRGAISTRQPARRISAASTKSCDRIGPPNGLLARKLRQARSDSAKARVRMMALWPQ